MELKSNHIAFLPLEHKGTYAAIQTTRGVSKGIHTFEVCLEIVDDSATTAAPTSGGNHFSIGVANDKYDMGNVYQGWTANNGGIGYYEGKTSFLRVKIDYSDGQVFGFGASCSSSKQSKGKYPLVLQLIIDMDKGNITFFTDDKFIISRPGLKGTVYPTLMLMGRGKVVHARILKAIKSSS